MQKSDFSKQNDWEKLSKTEKETNKKLQEEVRSYLELTGRETELRIARTGQKKIRVKNGPEVKIHYSKR